MTKKIFKIEGMDCDSCAKMIELDLEDAGYTGSCNFSKCTLEVEVAKSEDEKRVKEVLKKGGYRIAP